MIQSHAVYDEGGYQPGVPNGPGVPDRIPDQNMKEYREWDDGLKPPTLMMTSSDGYKIWLNEDLEYAECSVSRPGADHSDRAHVFHLSSTDPTIVAVAFENALWQARAVPAIVPTKRDAVKAAFAQLTTTQRDRLQASVTRRGSM